MTEQAKDYELVVLFTSTPSLAYDLKTARHLKDANPNLILGLVGPHVSILPADALQAGTAVDFVARREFVYTIQEVAGGRPWETIQGLSYRVNGKIRHNPDRPWVEDLDALPWVSEIYHRDLKIENYHIPYLKDPYVSIYTGRGCPSRCVYCLWPQTFTGRQYRRRSVADVAAEVRRALELFPQSQEIFFDDDTFTADGERAQQIADALRPLKCTWSATARATTSDETLKALKEGGLRLLVIGYESGNAQILKNIHKGATPGTGSPLHQMVQRIGYPNPWRLHGGVAGGKPRPLWKSPCVLPVNWTRIPFRSPWPRPTPAPNFLTFALIKAISGLAPGLWGNRLSKRVIDYPGLQAEEIFAALPKFYRRFYFRPRYMLRAAQTMLVNPAERRRLLKEAREFFQFLFRRQQGQACKT